MLRRVALVKTDVSEELSASFIRVTRIGELGTTQAVTSNRRTLRASVASYSWCCSSETSVLTRAHGVSSQKTPFFIVTAVKTSNLTYGFISQKTTFFIATAMKTSTLTIAVFFQIYPTDVNA
jgi:hypothetical protein